MIFAAGEGRRMRPLTLNTPKPLLTVGEQSLIERHIDSLQRSGFRDIIINLSYLGAQIEKALGDGARWGVNIQYSHEKEPLETGGALYQALPLLGDAPFVLVNGDVWCRYDFARARDIVMNDQYAHLLLTSNPAHNLRGDFCLKQGGLLSYANSEYATYTYSGIAILNPALIREYPDSREKFPLREAFAWAIEQSKITGELYDGFWCDVGTPERLYALRAKVERQT